VDLVSSPRQVAPPAHQRVVIKSRATQALGKGNSGRKWLPSSPDSPQDSGVEGAITLPSGTGGGRASAAQEQQPATTKKAAAPADNNRGRGRSMGGKQSKSRKSSVVVPGKARKRTSSKGRSGSTGRKGAHNKASQGKKHTQRRAEVAPVPVPTVDFDLFDDDLW
jgi:hypothetical protein